MCPFRLPLRSLVASRWDGHGIGVFRTIENMVLEIVDILCHGKAVAHDRNGVDGRC